MACGVVSGAPGVPEVYKMVCGFLVLSCLRLLAWFSNRQFELSNRQFELSKRQCWELCLTSSGEPAGWVHFHPAPPRCVKSIGISALVCSSLAGWPQGLYGHHILGS